MVDMEELKSLLQGLRSEQMAMLQEEHEIILRNLNDLEGVLEQAINIIRKIRRIKTTRTGQPNYSLHREMLPEEGQTLRTINGYDPETCAHN